MKALKQFVKFVRNQKTFVRIIAVFKFIFISFIAWYGLEVMAGERVLTPLDIAFSIGIPCLAGFISSIGLWTITTNIMRYKWPTLILYIPGLYFATVAVITPLMFSYPPQILKDILGILAVIIEILLLICFWNKNENA